MSDLAFKTLKLYTTQDSIGYYHNLAQHAMEPFSEFLTSVTSAVEKHIPSVSTKDILFKELT